MNDTQKKMKCLIFILSPQFEMQMEVVFLFMACRIAWPDNKSQRKMEAPIANFMLKISSFVTYKFLKKEKREETNALNLCDTPSSKCS